MVLCKVEPGNTVFQESEDELKANKRGCDKKVPAFSKDETAEETGMYAVPED